MDVTDLKLASINVCYVRKRTLRHLVQQIESLAHPARSVSLLETLPQPPHILLAQVPIIRLGIQVRMQAAGYLYLSISGRRLDTIQIIEVGILPGLPPQPVAQCLRNSVTRKLTVALGLTPRVNHRLTKRLMD